MDIQDKIYTFLVNFIEENRFSPSIREIASGCFINVATVIRYLDILEANGRIERTIGKARSIRISLDIENTSER